MAQTGLVLQGGGSLGAYELGVLKRLHEEPGFNADLVSGVSIGAINAAVLVGSRGKPIETLEALWDKISMPTSQMIPENFQQIFSLYGDPGFFQMRTDYLNAAHWTSFYDITPLRETLDEFINFEKIKKSKTRLFITAINIATGGIEVFDNQNMVITLDHILASCALPPGFPMVEINHNYYWDGGLFDKTPLSPVIRNMDPDKEIPKEIIIINLYPSQGLIPRTMMEVRHRAIEITLSNRCRSDFSRAARINEYTDIFSIIDGILPKDHFVRNLPAFQRAKQYKLIHDLIYIENNNPEVVYGGFDFSEKSIDARINGGYRDTDAALKSKPVRPLPSGLLRSRV